MTLVFCVQYNVANFRPSYAPWRATTIPIFKVSHISLYRWTCSTPSCVLQFFWEKFQI